MAERDCTVRKSRATSRGMAPHVYVEDLSQHVGQEVTLKGWLYNMAGKGKLYFLQVRDGTGIVQAVVFKADVPEEVFAKVGALKQEASIIVTGVVRRGHAIGARRRARRQGARGRRPADGGVPHLAQGARHGVPHVATPPVAALEEAGRGPPRAPRDHPPDPQLLRQPRLRADGRAHLHAQRLRGHDQPLRGRLLRRTRPT